MLFTKMQGTGNDYVILDCISQALPSNPTILAKWISHRHMGVGSDGLILVCPPISKDACCYMKMYNADGSSANMCGNGLRMVAHYAYEKKYAMSVEFFIDTDCGIRKANIHSVKQNSAWISVDMGRPLLEASKIPLAKEYVPDQKQQIILSSPYFQKHMSSDVRKFISSETDNAYEERLVVSCVGMGNPHCILFMKSIPEMSLLNELGPMIEHHPAFPQKTNVELVQIKDRNTLFMRVWERGAGETWACGSGTCAVLVAGVCCGLTDREATVFSPGGKLMVAWSKETERVTLTGASDIVYRGELQV